MTGRGRSTNHREALLDAMAALLWRRGYESTSPRAVLARSGAGQGSLYHHFAGKRDLAIQAMGLHEAALTSAAEAHLAAGGSAAPLAKVAAWLRIERDALAGCRLGRLAAEETVGSDDGLRAPMQRYFERLHALLSDRLGEAVAAGELPPTPAPAALASLLVAAVQGGYVLARATRDPRHLADAVEAAAALLGQGGSATPPRSSSWD